ncbi:N-acetylmuramoyl-L-alanine amidase [Ammonifex thiophilus]|uniref:N-acetylmuramoyl-L-alanine amidase n=1 Tax=Ammonifex thiophilus TaxID=444093 RepID=A0A3D8P7A4_9THEO|nr:N-acetylmuramoyl-L-alanine amidase [Ammonifex thiophilus]RDV84305.1 N-acetylmuramoyl-L-alanine amidase [Ammonifex thiophilus]
MRIVIDPGHGGSDPGAVCGNLREADLTLKLAKLMVEKVAPPATIILTRREDQDVSLSERVRIANYHNADLFLSLHFNAGGGRGFESYVYPSAPPLTRYYRQILHAAATGFLLPQGTRDRGGKEAPFYVLRYTRMPAVLLECLFLDHPEDARLLSQDGFLEALATAIAQGISVLRREKELLRKFLG